MATTAKRTIRTYTARKNSKCHAPNCPCDGLSKGETYRWYGRGKPGHVVDTPKGSKPKAKESPKETRKVADWYTPKAREMADAHGLLMKPMKGKGSGKAGRVIVADIRAAVAAQNAEPKDVVAEESQPKAEVDTKAALMAAIAALTKVAEAL